MAKGKHATALFEVIHASKQFGGKDGKEKAAGLLRTPKWWFKGRNKQADPTLRAASLSAATHAAPDEAPVGGVETGPAPAPPESAATPSPDATTVSASGRTPAVDVLVDPQQHRITFRVTYASAIVTCFAVGVVVALAYLVGRHMARGPAPALGGPTTEQLLQGPARPDVMDVGSGRRTEHAGAGGASGGPDQNAPAAQPQPPTAPPRTDSARPTALPAEPGRRVNGLNYVIIQSYPDEASAKAAVDILRQHGVGSTVERGLRGYSSSWHIVVSTDGFARVSSPEYTQFIQKLKQISDKFIGKRSFKAFDPTGYRWDRP